jgi:glycosyltransferase involved in cell wall biosynthesis
MSRLPWIFMEPYYGGSHRHLVDGLVERLDLPITLWTLPARKWKWRMRGAALHFAERWRREMPRAAGIFTSSMQDTAALRGLLPRDARSLQLIIYFHENQLRYPVQVVDKRDFHYAWTNIQSALAGDSLLWNSAYNLNSFLEELPVFMRRMPDARLGGLAKAVADRSTILPVPLSLQHLADRRGEQGPRHGPCRILWNHRWEHDKGPEIFFEALGQLQGEGLDFELSILGESFGEVPPVFDRARRELAHKIHCWGFRESREEYERELLAADIVVSTARHEFQGLSVLEAVAAGAVPVVPDDLAYREIWPDQCRYAPDSLIPTLRRAITGIEIWRGKDYRSEALAYDWKQLLPAWQHQFESG